MELPPCRTRARKRYDAFLSYNSQDRPAVHEVAERLKREGLVLYLEERMVWPSGYGSPAVPRSPPGPVSPIPGVRARGETLNLRSVCETWIGLSGQPPGRQPAGLT